MLVDYSDIEYASASGSAHGCEGAGRPSCHVSRQSHASTGQDELLDMGMELSQSDIGLFESDIAFMQGHEMFLQDSANTFGFAYTA